MPPLPPLHPGLLVATAHLTIKAQAVKDRNILDVWEELKTAEWPRSTFDPIQVQKSVPFICAIAGRFGMLNSCLVRALVAGRLLLGHDELMLHIGIHTQNHAESHAPSGHAWVECHGSNRSDPSGQQLPPGLRITHSISLSRGG